MGQVDQVEAVADGELRPLIRKVLSGAFNGASLKTIGWIRVSSLAALCPREEVLVATTGVERTDPFNGDLGLVFEHGHALHWVLQNRILPVAGVLYGKWRCMNCGEITGGWDATEKPRRPIQEAQKLRPKTCGKCETVLDATTSIYMEQEFANHEFRLRGHPDGFLMVPGMVGMGIFEAKSINPRGAWEVRSCPKLDHVVQVQCYMWLTGCKWAKILYWDKAGMGSSALIEHTVEKDDETIEAIKDEITSIWVGIEDGTLPLRTCKTRTCPRAEKCAVVDVCFSRD
jgi:hypothetical protein